ncbi:hypothetical protein QCA50_009188 [Cerrena zonata]|uniref:Uncharacterized protein n=1 Tax=Cerrena zonata TaxID=2478898 RepID=A0AAW0GCW6_9APHY
MTMCSTAVDVITNLVVATKTLLGVLWKPIRSSETLIHDNLGPPSLTRCIDEIRTRCPYELAADPIILTFVFSHLCWLASDADIHSQQNVLLELMDELTDALEIRDSIVSIDDPHLHLLESAYISFQNLGFINERLQAKIRELHPQLTVGRFDRLQTSDDL